MTRIAAGSQGWSGGTHLLTFFRAVPCEDRRESVRFVLCVVCAHFWSWRWRHFLCDVGLHLGENGCQVQAGYASGYGDVGGVGEGEAAGRVVEVAGG